MSRVRGGEPSDAIYSEMGGDVFNVRVGNIPTFKFCLMCIKRTKL